MKCCVRCKKFKAFCKPHSAVHIVRKGKLVHSTIKFVCAECSKKKGKWETA